MKQLRVVERISGDGTLSGDGIPALAVTYGITVRQWVHTSHTFGGASEDRGLYDIKADLFVPAAGQSSILRLLAQDAEADLLLSDGRKAKVVITRPGSIFGNTTQGHLQCSVNAFEGYT